MTKETPKKILHITEIGGCQKQFEFQLKETPTSPMHITSIKGIITHSAMFQLLSGKDIVFSKDIMLEGRDNVTNEVFEVALKRSGDLIDKGINWFNDTTLLKGEHPFILDFKTSKKIIRASFLRQLAGYEWLLDKINDSSIGNNSNRLRMEERITVKYNGWEVTGAIDLYKGYSNYEHYLVFFGGDDYEEYKLKNFEKKRGYKLFKEDLDKTILEREEILKGGKGKCKYGLCMFCKSRGRCIGI